MSRLWVRFDEELIDSRQPKTVVRPLRKVAPHGPFGITLWIWWSCLFSATLFPRISEVLSRALATSQGVSIDHGFVWHTSNHNWRRWNVYFTLCLSMVTPMDNEQHKALVAAAEFFNQTSRKMLTLEGRLHAETLIASTARMAGSLMYRSFGFDKTIEAGTSVLSEQYRVYPGRAGTECASHMTTTATVGFTFSILPLGKLPLRTHKAQPK